MISCEEFESRFPFDQSPEVIQHRENCPFCANFNQESAKLRSALTTLPANITSIGFEYRLQNRLMHNTGANGGGWNVMPKAVAFASGVAVVMVAGALYFGSRDNVEPEFSSQSDSEIIASTEVEAEADSTVSDTTSLQNKPWEYGWNLEAVSSNQ